jgi:hypothetical protein
MRLDALFTIKNGIASTGLSIESSKQPFHLPYLRPSNTQEGTIAGWVWLRDIDKNDIYPEHTLFVSTNGEGSHSYAYVSGFSCVANSDVAMLIPKRAMSLLEKIYYAECITRNRWKFSYGRKPKGKRLGAIELPDKMPDRFNKVNIEPYIEFSNSLECLFDIPIKKTIRAVTPEIPLVPLGELFDIKYGTSLELYKLDKCLPSNPRSIPFVSRSENNNGVTAFVEKEIGIHPNPGHTLSVAMGGSVLASFYQSQPYYSGFHIIYLTPRRTMEVVEMLYYSMIIRANRYRYSYGRQANKTFKHILVPTYMPKEFLIDYVSK